MTSEKHSLSQRRQITLGGREPKIHGRTIAFPRTSARAAQVGVETKGNLPIITSIPVTSAFNGVNSLAWIAPLGYYGQLTLSTYLAQQHIRFIMAIDSDVNRTIKIILSQEEQDLIRLAAAIRRASMSEYCRSLAIEDAKQLVGKLDPTFLAGRATSQKARSPKNRQAE